jgi:hypothetical protein
MTCLLSPSVSPGRARYSTWSASARTTATCARSRASRSSCASWSLSSDSRARREGRARITLQRQAMLVPMTPGGRRGVASCTPGASRSADQRRFKGLPCVSPVRDCHWLERGGVELFVERRACSHRALASCQDSRTQGCLHVSAGRTSPRTPPPRRRPHARARWHPRSPPDRRPMDLPRCGGSDDG